MPALIECIADVDQRCACLSCTQNEQRFYAEFLSERELSTTKPRRQYVSEENLETVLAIEEDDECPHDEHDHFICLNCGTDLTDKFVGQAESHFEGDR